MNVGHVSQDTVDCCSELLLVQYIGAAGLGATDISRACELSADATSWLDQYTITGAIEPLGGEKRTDLLQPHPSTV